MEARWLFWQTDGCGKKESKTMESKPECELNIISIKRRGNIQQKNTLLVKHSISTNKYNV